MEEGGYSCYQSFQGSVAWALTEQCQPQLLTAWYHMSLSRLEIPHVCLSQPTCTSQLLSHRKRGPIVILPQEETEVFND